MTINGVTIESGKTYDFQGYNHSAGGTVDGLTDVTIKNLWTLEKPIIFTNAHGVRLVGGASRDCDHWMIAISGGDRFTPGNNSIEDWEFSDCRDIVTTQLSGWGNSYKRCRVANVKGRAFQVAGCNSGVISCEVHHACAGWDDIGALYFGNADGNQYGNYAIGNHIYDIQGLLGASFTNGIYCDAHASEMKIEYNRLERIRTNGIAFSGGRDNLVRRNYIDDCKNGVQIDDRNGDSWPSWAKAIQLATYQTLWPRQWAMTAQDALVNGTECYVGDYAAWPIGNQLIENYFTRCNPLYIRTGSGVKASGSYKRDRQNVTFVGNVIR